MAATRRRISIGALEPAVTLEEFVPFVPGEASWRDAGGEMPPELARIEARLAQDGEGGEGEA